MLARQMRGEFQNGVRDAAMQGIELHAPGTAEVVNAPRSE